MNGHHHNYFSVDIAFYNFFCYNVDVPHDIKCSQKQLELKFADLRNLVLILPEAATGGVPEVVYVTTGNAAFCLVLYLTGVHF